MTASVVDGPRIGGPTTRAKDGGVGANRGYSLLLVVAGLAGLLASWVITLDKNHILEARARGETFTPACSLNPVVSCGNIMESDQAEAFGFPNPMLGLVGYGVVVAIGMGLLGGARFPRWFWLGLQGGTLFGVLFCTWLQYQSLYTIKALCLWCCLAWVATIVMFWYTMLHLVRHGVLPAPRGLRQLMEEFPWLAPAVHVAVIGLLILTNWWDFWTR